MLAPCPNLLCSGVTSAKPAQEASHSNSFSCHLPDVPGASPAATAVPNCTRDTGAQTPLLCRVAPPSLCLSSTVLFSHCTGPCPAPLLPSDSTGTKAPQPGERCTSSAELLHARATCGHQPSAVARPLALGHPETTGSFSN